MGSIVSAFWDEVFEQEAKEKLEKYSEKLKQLTPASYMKTIEDLKLEFYIAIKNFIGTSSQHQSIERVGKIIQSLSIEE
jgi:phosphopantetheine adenylyltransferase